MLCLSFSVFRRLCVGECVFDFVGSTQRSPRGICGTRRPPEINLICGPRAPGNNWRRLAWHSMTSLHVTRASHQSTPGQLTDYRLPTHRLTDSPTHRLPDSPTHRLTDSPTSAHSRTESPIRPCAKPTVHTYRHAQASGRTGFGVKKKT